MEHHVASCQVLKQEAERLKREKEFVEQDLSEWKKKFVNLEEESKKLLEDMKKELERKDQVIEDLGHVNEELKSYIDFLEKSNGYAYKGKSISDVKKKSRTLNCFLSRAKTALWFAESFGLDVSSINITEKTTGVAHSVSLCESNNVPGRNNASDTESETQTTPTINFRSNALLQSSVILANNSCVECPFLYTHWCLFLRLWCSTWFVMVVTT